MRRWNWIVPALTAVTLAAPGHSATVLASLYKGQTAQAAGLVLGGWGSGLAKESKDEAFNGAASILVSTEGYYSGARLDFAQPVDMSKYATVNGVSLRFLIKPVGYTSDTGAGGLVPGGGMQAGPPIAGGPMMPGAQRGYTGTSEETAPTIATKALRVVLISGASRVAAVNQAVDPDSNSNGWIQVFVPLAAFHATGGAAANWDGFKVNRMLVFGDTTDTFYIGDISLVQTDLSITDVSAGDEQDVAAGDTAEFTGTAAMAEGLKFSWDFDSTDGIQEDAIGKDVTYRYRNPGTYTVTLTVSDPTGVMKPVTKTTIVKVNG